MNLFYSKNISNQLSKSESKHCLFSLRMNINDDIYITDGIGNIYKAKIQQIKNQIVMYGDLELISINKKKIRIHIAIAPTKNKTRFEWFLEKVTEIGIDSIFPIICQNSERKKLNQIRCENILISAIKQSKNSVLPIIYTPIKFEDFINSHKKNSYIAHCHKTDKKSFNHLLKENNHTEDITLFIGPEGDFSEKEVNFAYKKGIIPVELGKTRLRTETAGVVGCTIMNLSR